MSDDNGVETLYNRISPHVVNILNQKGNISIPLKFSWDSNQLLSNLIFTSSETIFEKDKQLVSKKSNQFDRKIEILKKTLVDDSSAEFIILKNGQSTKVSNKGNFPLALSHSENISSGLCYDSNFQFGVDIECSRERNDKIVIEILNQDELALMESIHLPSLPITFWTAKEAISKASGTGLTQPFEMFRISQCKQIHSNIVKFFFPEFQDHVIYGISLEKLSFSFAISKYVQLTIK